jgi:hypothetical protein
VVFFLEEKGETFGFVRDLVFRLRNERHGDAIRAIHSDNGSEFRNSRFETFCHDLGHEHQFSSPYKQTLTSAPSVAMIGTRGKRMVEMIIMLMTRTSPTRSEARRRRLTEGLM